MGDELVILKADAEKLPLADLSVDLVLGSPPYCDARTYGIDAQRDCVSWVRWMIHCTEEALRVSRGLVLWVAAGVTHDGCYQPGPEGLIWEWYRQGRQKGCELLRPAYWHRQGIPGGGGKQWLRNDIEYVMAFKRPGKLPWADNTAMGHPPLCPPGGRTSNRNVEGKRVRGNRVHPKLVNPGNLIRTKGGHLGSKLAHENEAPFPEDLAEFFIRSWCPPGGVVLDPFCGSGTVAAVALKHGRRAIASDIRQSQVNLTRRRVAEVMAERGELREAV